MDNLLKSMKWTRDFESVVSTISPLRHCLIPAGFLSFLPDYSASFRTIRTGTIHKTLHTESRRLAIGAHAITAKGLTAVGILLAILSTPLQAAELKSTFVFSTPYVDARGTVDKGDDIKYQMISFWTPLKPGEVFDVRARIESYSGDIRVLSYPLEGVCDNLGNALSCHLGNEFVGFTTVIRLDGKDTWGEINATRGMFGTDYNVMGLSKSEVVE